jgi:D-alanyl-lipoteichoic acid acyltransferase DltB (MBOAT superfamily)
MLFNSFEFLLFLPTVFVLYWFVFNKNIKVQNVFLLLASYLFYGWWDWRFLSLILISSFLDYFIGIKIESSEKERCRKYYKYLSLFVNLGFLGVFKYFNFFIDSFTDLLLLFGLTPSLPVLRILLPIGISFYTFQTIGYTLDVYKRKLKAERGVINFLLYVCFFPQLVAGPIERARNLLPQIREKRVFSQKMASDGLRQILIGLFKKIVIADNIANSVDIIFANYETQSSVALLLGGFFFLMQVYCDFAGYSDIAIGTAKLFGFKLMKNFDFPFYSTSVQEFWTRWHISLSNWFRDYLLLGLKSSYRNRNRFALNFLFTLTIIGLWHGANWTFVCFGLLNGLFIIPRIIWKNSFRKKKKLRTSTFPNLIEFANMVKVYVLVSFTAVFFRSPNFLFAYNYFKSMLSNINSNIFNYSSDISPTLLLFFIPLLFEWPLRNKEHSLDIASIQKPIRWGIYIILILVMINYGEFHYKQFIYFQF